MLLPMSPVDSLFLLAESREHPMHVGGLQLFEPPDGADAMDVRKLFDAAIASEEPSEMFRKHARRSIATLGRGIGGLLAHPPYPRDMGVHHVKPGSVSITQATEWCTAYRPTQIAAIASVATATSVNDGRRDSGETGSRRSRIRVSHGV